MEDLDNPLQVDKPEEDVSDLLDVKLLFEKIRLKIGRFMKPTPADLNALTRVVVKATAEDRMGSDEEFAKFVNDEMAIGLMNKLASTTSYDDELLNAVADLMDAFVDLYALQLNKKRFNESLTCAMTWCFKADTTLHSEHFQLSQQELKALTTQVQVWRQEIQVGQQIDIKIYGDPKGKTQGWVQGKVNFISNDLLSVEIPDLPPSYDQDIDRWSIKLAPFETHTKEDYEWRREWANVDNKNVELDMYDHHNWEEGTMFDIFEENHDGRAVLVGFVGYRIYRTTGKRIREDERGVFDGWTSKFDENIPVFSPRIQKHYSCAQKNSKAEEEEILELDHIMKPAEGHDRVYCVPRIGHCLSRRFCHMMNCFGNAGGFTAILETFKNEKADTENLTLTMMMYMVRMISMPIKLFHKDWISQFGIPIAKAIMNQLLEAPDKVLRSVTAENISQLQISINGINTRVMEKEQAKLANTSMKLEMTKRFMTSELLDRRILGIKELNTIVKNTYHFYGNNVFTLEQLINWCKEHGVFDILWDPRTTHQQLVQRSNEIFKILPKEDLLSPELLQQFWNLTKSDYKSEVFKIINETALYLKQEHIEFLFDQITETPAAKLGMEEFEAIASLGRESKSLDFSTKSSNFFWSIIIDSGDHQNELVETVVNKFSDMIRFSSMEKKAPYFDKLVGQLTSYQSSAIPVIRLFKKIIKDQKARSSYSSGTYSSSYGTGGTGYGSTTVVNHGISTTQDGKTLYSRSYGQSESIYAGQDADTADDESKALESKNLTLRQVLNNLVDQKGFVQALLNNLTAYCEAVAAKVAADPSLLREQDRSKLFLVSAKYSHQEEFIERLSFLQEFAVNSDFKISKAQLKVIYDLINKSPIKSDFTEFLTWCSTACASVIALDLELVGEFFSELISSSALDLRALPVVGFEFLKMHFITINLSEGKLTKIVKPTKATSGWSTTYTTSGTVYSSKDKDEEKSKDDDATVMIDVEPSELINLEIMWTIALESQVAEVVTKSIAFLVNCYLSVASSMEDRRNEILQNLNSRCFGLLNASEDQPERIKRIVLILETCIKISEKKGTGGVQPHNAILKGEMLDRIIVRFMAKKKVGYGNQLKHERSIIIKLYTSATVWELKREVSKMLSLAPKYIKLKLPNGSTLRDNQHGMTLQELSLKNGEILTAMKNSIKENVVEAPLVDRVKSVLVPRAIEIFTQWFHQYKNQKTGLMDSHALARFVAAATQGICGHDDERVEKIMTENDSDDDKNLDLKDFLKFYYVNASGPHEIIVRKNLKALNIRADLKPMNEIFEDLDFSETEMPRYTLSANQDQFQALFNLLDRNNAASKDVWNLVRMLATNQKMYQEVLSLSNAQSDTGIEWDKVFEDKSLYRQIYKQEIIVAVMEATSAEDDGRRVMFVEDLTKSSTTSYTVTGSTSDANLVDGHDFEEEDKDDTETQTPEKSEAAKLKENWTKQFLEHSGWDYILSSFIGVTLSSDATTTFGEQASLKDLSFRLTLLRVFLQGGFSSQQGDLGQAIQLVRRSSSIVDEGEGSSKKQQKEQEQFEQLMKSAAGQEIMLTTDFAQLLDKTMQLITSVLSKSVLIFEDKLIIQNALSILAGILLYRKELYSKFVGFKSSGSISDCEQLVLAGLLSNEEKVRIDFKSCMTILACGMNKGEDNALIFLMGILARNFASIQNKPSRQFFDLLNKLIDLKSTYDALSPETASDGYNPEELLNQTIDKIKQQQAQSTEGNNDGDAGDEVEAMELEAEQERLLVGLISLAGKIIAKADKAVSDRIISEKDLIGQIFKEFLFASYFQAKQESAYGDAIVIQQQAGSRKESKKAITQNNKSRQAAYELLHQLIKNSGILMKKFLEKQLQPLIATIKKPKTWHYQPPTASDPGMSQKYVGLVNLGCICYMNSMMQQFFMTNAFRYNLLCVDDGKDPEFAEYRGDRIDDNMMHQLQKLIAHLELSKRMAYNPKEFCFAFKEFDGSPTNTAEQKDAQEFLNLLFDRLETALKPTSRKHLVNGIFGGKLCSQMVCSECGKVKNRMEDYLNLSLPVKGVKSIEESLQKQVEGEIISDYQCDGCDRKVDLNKRTMIASTPNVLIVHLQRICFNFDTFQNDKVNSYCSFPNVLDLKPYSFHTVMGKEGRLKAQQEEEGFGQQQQANEDELTEEELAARKEAEEEAREPDLDDCFEYKLVGVNVHSGTANAGHYWSYINTNRGTDERPDDPNWIKPELDPWMEFNDSRVSDWDFKELKRRTFGTQKNESMSTGGYMSALGDSYGTSAYMLFYERRKKKDLKILVPTEQVEQAKAKGVNLHYDEKGEEHYEMRPYRSAADGELANDIYMKVAEDNQKFTFENDIYSTEFFDFIMRILQTVADSDVDSETKLHGMDIGSKVGFEILARMIQNPGIDRISQVMIDILASRSELSQGFLSKMCEFPASEVLWEVLFECGDKSTQKDLARILKFALCQLKEVERDAALSGEAEAITSTFTDDQGVEQTCTEERPKSVCLRFMKTMVEQLSDRAPKHWRKFDAYLEIFYSFMVNSSDDILANRAEFDTNSEAYKTGVEMYFINNMIMHLGDFVLREKSPYHDETRVLIQMEATWGQPNFASLLKTIICMVSDKAMLAKYPLDEKNSAVVSHQEILQKMLEPGEEDYSDVLVEMARDNFKVSKKMAKSCLKSIRNTNNEKATKQTLNYIRNFFKIDDSLKQSRLEWIFGIAQVNSKPDYRTRLQKYGIEQLVQASDDYYLFKSACVKLVQDGFLGSLFKDKGRIDQTCVTGLAALVQIMAEDENVARYVFDQPSPSIQYARYTDWFFSYAEDQYNAIRPTSTYQSSTYDYNKNKRETLEKILELKEQLEPKFNAWIEEQNRQLAAIGADKFVGYAHHSLQGQVPEVIPSYPPVYIVGQMITSEPKVLLVEDTEFATIKVEEVSCEYMYSNPNGRHNLSCPDKTWRDVKTYRNLSYNSWRINNMTPEERESDSADKILVKDWISDRFEGSVILRVMAKSKHQKLVRVGITLSVDDDADKNVNFSLSEIKENLFASDSKQLFVFTKIDPSKDSWGNNLKCIVNAKPGKTAQVQSSAYGYSSTYTGGYLGGYSYQGSGSNSTSYASNSYYNSRQYQQNRTNIYDDDDDDD